MQVPMKGWAAVVSMALLAACTQVPSSGSAPASSAGATNTPQTALGDMPVTVNCGEGKQPLVRQMTFDGRTQSQVDCVDMPRQMVSRDVRLLEDDLEVAPPAPPARRTVYRPRRSAPERVVVRETPREEEAPVEEPRVYRTSSRRDDDVTISDDEAPARTSSSSRTSTGRRKRPGAESAAIIVGSTAAGAGAGAILGGKKGAVIGAVLGGAAGTVYDRTTRNPK